MQICLDERAEHITNMLLWPHHPPPCGPCPLLVQGQHSLSLPVAHDRIFQERSLPSLMVEWGFLITQVFWLVGSYCGYSENKGLLWRLSGSNSELPMQGAWV